MLTVMVAFVGSGKRRTWRPLASAYSVMPSTEVTLTGAAAAGDGAGADWAAALDRPRERAKNEAMRRRAGFMFILRGPAGRRCIRVGSAGFYWKRQGRGNGAIAG